MNDFERFTKKTSSFNEEGCALWKEKIRIFMEGINFDIWKYVKNATFVPTY